MKYGNGMLSNQRFAFALYTGLVRSDRGNYGIYVYVCMCVLEIGHGNGANAAEIDEMEIG